MKTILTSDLLGGILFDIQKERERQNELMRLGKFTWTCASPEVGNPEKLAVLAEEFGEAAREVTELLILRGKETLPRKAGDEYGEDFRVQRTRLLGRLRKELIEVATVAVAWCEALDSDATQIMIEEQKAVVFVKQHPDTCTCFDCIAYRATLRKETATK